MGGAKTEKTQQNNNNSKKGMPVEEWRKDGVAPFNTPPQLEGASNHGSKVARKENEVTSRKAATFIPKAQERGESED